MPAIPSSHRAAATSARELRDRYLEQMNAGLILPGGDAKYDVSRQLSGPQAAPMASRLLDAA